MRSTTRDLAKLQCVEGLRAWVTALLTAGMFMRHQISAMPQDWLLGDISTCGTPSMGFRGRSTKHRARRRYRKRTRRIRRTRSRESQSQSPSRITQSRESQRQGKIRKRRDVVLGRRRRAAGSIWRSILILALPSLFTAMRSGTLGI